MKTPKSLLVVLIDILGEQQEMLFPTWLPNVEKLFESAFGKVGSAFPNLRLGGGA